MSESCPVCLAQKVSAFDSRSWRIDGVYYALVKCQSCSSAFTSPRPSDAVLEKLYRTSFDYRWYRDHYDVKLLDCRERVKELGVSLGGRVLDFGGGVGYFSQAANEAGLQSVTYDPYVNSDRPVKGSWDSVIALHVLEHSSDLERTVSQIKEFLAPGGRLIIAVPNFAGLGYQELGMRWVWAQPPLMHVFHFTASGLKALLTRHGFSNLEVTYHERWDANHYCDVQHVEQFRLWDADWSRFPANLIPYLRRRVARRNSERRLDGLKKALTSNNIHGDALAELQITGVMSAE